MAEFLTAQELCNAVYEAVVKANKPMSRKEIAEAFGHKKSPRVSDMVEHLVTLGYFSKCEGLTKFGKAVLLYSLAGVETNGDPCKEWAQATEG